MVVYDLIREISVAAPHCKIYHFIVQTTEAMGTSSGRTLISLTDWPAVTVTRGMDLWACMCFFAQYLQNVGKYCVKGISLETVYNNIY